VEKVIEVLMSEHRLIEQALGSLETCALEVRGGAPLQTDVVGEYVDFFRAFTDGCHHGKEEEILFQRLIERGFPRQAGPLAVMYYEHELGRAQVKGLGAIAGRTGAAHPEDSVRFVAHADDYVPLLRAHILKEDNVLYPMALEVLSGPELDAMSTEFDAFEAVMRADGSYDRLQRLAERLTTRFRPDPARMAAAAEATHCRR
jgi:hemerythrin-like domain-containing protein